MNDLSSAELLAIAVLRGDTDAALALADEVLLTYRRTSNRPPIPESLGAFGFSTRVRRALKGGYCSKPICTTVSDLLHYTADDLLGLRNFGQTCLAEVRAKLAAHGLALLNDPPPLSNPIDETPTPRT